MVHHCRSRFHYLFCGYAHHVLWRHIRHVGLIALAIFLLVRSNIHYSKKQKDKGKDDIFSRLIASKDKEERWRLLRQHVNNTLVAEMAFTNETYRQITDGFINENLKALRKAVNNTDNQKEMLKKIRRKEILVCAV